jgi:hypothetical protein
LGIIFFVAALRYLCFPSSPILFFPPSLHPHQSSLLQIICHAVRRSIAPFPEFRRAILPGTTHTRCCSGNPPPPLPSGRDPDFRHGPQQERSTMQRLHNKQNWFATRMNEIKHLFIPTNDQSTPLYFIANTQLLSFDCTDKTGRHVPLYYMCACLNAYLLSPLHFQDSQEAPRLYVFVKSSMHCLSSRACYVSKSSSKNTDITAGILACLRIPSRLICNSCAGDIWVEWLFSTKTSLLLLQDKEKDSGLSSKQVREEGKTQLQLYTGIQV